MSYRYSHTGSADSPDLSQGPSLSRQVTTHQSGPSRPYQDGHTAASPPLSPTLTVSPQRPPLPSSSSSSSAASSARHIHSDDPHAVTRPPRTVIMDRKRRLTGSAYEQARRRYPAGDSVAGHGGAGRDDSSSASAPLTLQQTRSNDGLRRADVVDLTASSPTSPRPSAPSPPRQRPSRTRSSSSRQYAVPRWQPDSEATECPICQRPFTWIFRRHHCRKCGRVVCNDCSPHRITIPRQLIVNPPGPETNASTIDTTHDIIDLTGDEDDFNTPLRRARTSSNIFLDGGEKVRLCNPCVPDPQPQPFPSFASIGGDERRAQAPRFFPYGSAISPFGGNTGPFERPRASGRRDMPSSLPGSATTLYTSRTRPSFPPNLFPMPHASSDADAARLFNSALPPLPRHFQSRPGHGHARYASLDSSSGLSHPDLTARPRMSSLVEGGPTAPRFGLGQAPAAARERPAVNEEDICPVCHRVLPARGPDGDESAREAHIMACISAREPDRSSNAASSSRGTLHMISFAASEKDCVADDGSQQECSICMEEYDVGDELARLECWCKFHKRCIVSWLNKKAECPVHKMAAFS